MKPLKKGDKKLLFAWSFYDWANSVYPLVISTALFPIFYGELFEIKGDSHVDVLGFSVKNTALISFVSSIGFLLVSVISPFLSGISDYLGNKKGFMKVFCYMGASSCIGLYWFDLDSILSSLTLYVMALVGFWGSVVFYNSYLPDIAYKNQQDALSAKGYAMGYIGSVLLLILCLAIVMNPEVFGIEDKMSAMRRCFVLVGIWWISFSQYTFFYMPKGAKTPGNSISKQIITKGFRELMEVAKSLRHQPVLKKYLSGFFVYSMAVQTVMIMATYFGEQEVRWTDASEKTIGLIVSILIIQFIAVIGAVLTAKVSKIFGNIRVLIAINIFWAGTCIYAYFIYSPLSFYIAACMVGVVMGGVQTLSRSTYSKLIPETKDTASFFSFFDVTEKIGIVTGIFTFGIIDQITGSVRNSILFLVTFFLIGIFILYRLHKKHGKTIDNNR